ncbi:MAG TPA: sigma-70 family RNA polymerase sigma factor [Candidatus Angelobacter sp.]
MRRTHTVIAGVVLNTCRRWQEPSRSLGDDLIQDTYVKLFANDRKALRSIKNEYENTIYGFLKVVASNVVCDHFRQSKNKVVEIEPTDLLLPPSSDGANRIEIAQRKHEIERKLEELSATPTYNRDMAVFWLHHAQGYTAKEISLLPGIALTVKGVEALLFRLMRFLRDGLGPPEDRGKDRSQDTEENKDTSSAEEENESG